MTGNTSSIIRYKCTSCGSFHHAESEPDEYCPVCGDEGGDLWIPQEIKLDSFKRSGPIPDIALTAITAPTMTSPVGPPFIDQKLITITSSHPGAVIHYTLDGSDPDHRSPIYDSAFCIVRTTTVKALAVVNGKESAISSNTYYKDSNSRPPVIFPAGGAFKTPIRASITNKWPGATVKYSIGGAPYSIYYQPVMITKSCTLEAYSSKRGVRSAITKTRFTIEHSPPHEDMRLPEKYYEEEEDFPKNLNYVYFIIIVILVVLKTCSG